MLPTYRSTPIVIALLCAAAMDAPLATNCTHIEDAQARACCERNLPERSMQQDVTLTVADVKGTVSNLAAELYWKRFEDGRARARVDITEPARQAGTIVLLTERESETGDEPREPEVVVYKPGERRDRLLTVSALSGEMFGTDFSYEDFAHFYGTDPDVDVVRLDDEQWEGHTVVVVQSTPRDPEAAFDRGSMYTRIVTRFDAEQCVPLVTQFFEQGDELRKKLVATPEEIRPAESRWIPHRLVMYDLAEETRTILNVDKIEFDPDIKDRFFERSSLKRGR
jgi:hypothetical protein